MNSPEGKLVEEQQRKKKEILKQLKVQMGKKLTSNNLKIQRSSGSIS